MSSFSLLHRHFRTQSENFVFGERRRVFRFGKFKGESQDPEASPKNNALRELARVFTGALRGVFGAKRKEQAMAIAEKAGMTRRDFLKVAGAALAVAALPSLALAEEAEVSDATGALVDTIERSPELIVQNKDILDFVITLLFTDAIVAIGKQKKEGEPEDTKVSGSGKTVARLAGKAFGKSIEEYDHHFPHTNLGLMLAALAVKAGMEGGGEEVAHSFVETGVGVGMLVPLASYGKSLEAKETPYLERIAEEDRTTTNEAEKGAEEEVNIGEKIAKFNDALVEVMGVTPLAVALAQFPLLAFGSAKIGLEKMLSCRKIMKDIFCIFDQMSYEQIQNQLSSIPNPVVKKLLENFLKTKRDDMQGTFSSQDIDALTSQYSSEVFSGELMAFTDITQASVGDVGPAVVAQLQNFGVQETIAGAMVNFVYALVTAEAESFSLAQRMGVDPKKMMSFREHQQAGAFMAKTWANLIFTIFEAIRITGQMGMNLGVGLFAGEGFAKAGETWAAGTQMAYPDAPDFRVLPGMVQDMLNATMSLWSVATNGNGNFNKRSVRQAVEEIAKALAIRDSYARGNKKIEKNRDLFGPLPNSAFTNLDTIEAIVAKMTPKQTLEDEQVTNLRNQVQEFLTAMKKCVYSSQYTLRGVAVEERVKQVFDLLSENPQWYNLFQFDHWEAVLGPEIAETAYVVFLQGLGVTSVANSLRFLVLSPNSLLTSTTGANFHNAPEIGQHAVLAGMTTGESMFADNWAGALLSGSQEFFDVAYPGMLRDFSFLPGDISQKDITGDGHPPAFGKLLSYFQNLEKHLETKLSEANRPSEIPKMKKEIRRRKAVAKYLSTIFSVRGGGFTTIGNSPHFIMLVKAIGNDITLASTLRDIPSHPVQNSVRLGGDFVWATQVAPTLDPVALEIAGRMFPPSAEKIH